MLMSTMVIHSSTFKFNTLLSNITPALFTNTSILPNALTVSAISDSQSEETVTSSLAIKTWPGNLAEPFSEST